MRMKGERRASRALYARARDVAVSLTLRADGRAVRCNPRACRLVRTIDKCNGYAMAGIELERFDQIHGLSEQTDDPAEAALEDGLFDANAGESIDEMARAIAARAGGRTRGASGPDSDHDDGYDGGH